MTELTFLGTGNFVAPPGRYWNSFVMDASVLVEPSPTALPHLRRCGFPVEAIEVVVVSHFHADHCFGWPFLLQAAAEGGGGRTLHVVGPPGIEAHLAKHERGGGRGLGDGDMARAAWTCASSRSTGPGRRPGRCASGPSRSCTCPTCAASATCSTGASRVRIRRSASRRRDTTPVRRADRAGPRGRRPGGGVQRAAHPARRPDLAHGRGVGPRPAGAPTPTCTCPHAPGRAGGHGVA